jgi:peptidoglycan/xylan/chitin deacetylase (PgdA/CDA1 family)
MPFKQTSNKIIQKIIERVGHKIIPVILKLKGENNRLLIFYFHGLYKSSEQKELHHVDPQNNITNLQFEEFVEYFISHKYKFIKPEDLNQQLVPGQRYAMITFDDGYFNNMLALNVLEKYRVPALFFISTNYIKENRSYWWDIIYKYRHKQGIPLAEIRNEQLLLKGMKWWEIDTYIGSEFGEEAHKPWSDIDRPFTKLEITTIAKHPLISIGNHTHHHAILTNCDSNEALNEMNECNNFISALTGQTPSAIAFPNGNFDSNLLALAKQVGFRFAFTTQSQLNKLPFGDEEIICLNRFMAKTENVRKYGSFARLGYSNGELYGIFKNRVKNILKLH